MPRSSRHRSSHKSHRHSSPVDWSASDEERESEPERKKSSHSSKELKDSSNGHGLSDHGKKRKDRAEAKDEDRWDSSFVREKERDRDREIDGDEEALVEKRSKGEGYGPALSVEKEKEKDKYLKDASKSRSSRRHEGREKEKDREREKERESEKRREKEKEKEKERKRHERYEEEKKEKYEETRKREAEIPRVEEIGPKKEIEITQIEASEKFEKEPEKHSKRRKDEASISEKEKIKEKEKKSSEYNKDGTEDRKHHSHTSSRERKSESDKHREKHRDEEREKRHREREREREERREREYAEYRRYKKRNGSDNDPFEEYSGGGSKHSSRGSKRVYDETEDKYERENRDSEIKEDYNNKYSEKDKDKEKEKEKLDSSPRDQSRQRSKAIESPKKELEERGRNSTGGKTPSKFREKSNKPDQLEISSSTPRSETHYSSPPPPSNSSHYNKYSRERNSGGGSKYRDRERERDADMAVPDKLVPKREPTPIGTSNRPNNPNKRGNYNYNNNNNNNINNSNNANNNWNNGSNWAAANGFMQMTPGPPAQHGFNPFGAPPPPIFGMRPPPLKLGPTGVSFHDPMDRFSMRPFGWHNSNNPLLDEMGNPNMWDPFWGAQNNNMGSGVGSNMWKGHDVVKETGTVPPVPVPVLKIEEKSEKESLVVVNERVEVKEEIVQGKVRVETPEKLENREMVPLVEEKIVEINLWEKYVERIFVSKDLVDDVELYNKCASVLSVDLGMRTGVSSSLQVSDKNGKMNSVLKSLFPTNQDVIFKRAMAVYKKLAGRSKPEPETSNKESKEENLEITKMPELVENENISNSSVIIPYDEGNNKITKMEVENEIFNNNNSEPVSGGEEIPNIESTH